MSLLLTLLTARNHEIYELAVHHDLIILEDDPYYYLDFGSGLSPSLLSIDERAQGSRVLRFDSFSKVKR